MRKSPRGQDLPRTARPLSRAKVSRGPRPELPTHFRMRKSPGGKTCPGLPDHFRMRKAPGGQDQSCRLTFACESLPGAKTRAADSLSHAKVSPGGSTSPFLEIGLDQIRDVGIEWNLQFIAQDRHALMDRFWQSQRDCLALRVDPGPSPGRHSPIPPERMGFFLCWRRVRLHAAIEQS